jgi:PAS domain S-box-containing protein
VTSAEDGNHKRAAGKSHEHLKSAARLNAIVRSAVDGIISIDVRGVVETFNPAAESMFGYAAQEIIGRNISLLMAGHDRAHHDDYLRAYLSGGPKRVIGIGREIVGRRKDGTEFPLHLSIGEAKIDQERIFTGILRDLSEARRLEHEFLQAQKMEAVGRLASGIAHDFNNLLMGIIGCADIALERVGTANHAGETAYEPITALRQAAKRGSAIVAELLAFSRKSASVTVVIDVNIVVTDIGHMVASLLGADIAFHVILPKSPAWIRADAGQFEQVLMNLLVNARHAMPEGGELTLEVERSPRHVTVRVRDTGCGMDTTTQAKVFEPFFTTKPRGDGTGLGLSTAYAIIQRFEGTIELESTPGAGTCFTMQFPSAPAPKTTTRAVSDTAQTAAERPTQTILVVEDDALVRLSVRHYLTKNGYSVLEADSSESALTHAHADPPPTLLLTDIVLPDLSGDALAGRLGALLPELRVVFMSAHDRRYLTDNKRISADALTLQKPFSEQQLVNTLAKALATAGSPRSGK